MNDFSTANPFRYQLLNLQVVFEPWVHSLLAANVLAWTTFGIGLGLWLWTTRRIRAGDELLALSSLLMLGMLPIYHRSYDSAAALLGLAWLLKEYRRLGRFSHILLGTVLAMFIPLAFLLSQIGMIIAHSSSALALTALQAYASFSLALVSFLLVRAGFRVPIKQEGGSDPVVILRGDPIERSQLAQVSNG